MLFSPKLVSLTSHKPHPIVLWTMRTNNRIQAPSPALSAGCWAVICCKLAAGTGQKCTWEGSNQDSAQNLTTSLSLLLLGWHTGSGHHNGDYGEQCEEQGPEWAVEEPAHGDGQQGQRAGHTQGKRLQSNVNQVPHNRKPVHCREN